MYTHKYSLIIINLPFDIVNTASLCFYGGKNCKRQIQKLFFRFYKLRL